MISISERSLQRSEQELTKIEKHVIKLALWFLEADCTDDDLSVLKIDFNQLGETISSIENKIK